MTLEGTLSFLAVRAEEALVLCVDHCIRSTAAAVSRNSSAPLPSIRIGHVHPALIHDSEQ